MKSTNMENKFKDFFAQYNNKYVDFDGYYGSQCFDLVQYWSKYIGGHRFGGGYAKEIYNQPGIFYVQVPNTPIAVPNAGDIVVWAGSYNGGPGHTGIATGKGDVNTFECFEQNDPIGSNSHIRQYQYNHVIGWLRPKSISLPDAELIKQIKAKINTQITDTEFRNWTRKLLGV